MSTQILDRKIPASLARLSPDTYPALFFWINFFLLNILLFLPTYLVNRETADFFPPPISQPNPNTSLLQDIFIWRNNLDPFRLHGELIFFLALWVFLPWLRRPGLRRPILWVFSAFYTLALAYAVYESVAISFYQVDPTFYAQVPLFLNGIEFLLRHLPYPVWVYGLGLLAAVGVLTAVFVLINTLINQIPAQRLGRGTRLAIALLFMITLTAGLRMGSALASPKSAVGSLVFKLWENGRQSLVQYHQAQAIDDLPFYQTYTYSGQDLLAKPNIYLIFVESYGSILYKHPELTPGYLEKLHDVEARLTADGWSMATTLSDSPIWGGGSWMAYTSVLFGLRVDSQPIYDQLLANFQDVEYPDLARYLKSQGYYYVRASSLLNELKDDEWLAYQAFYGSDLWLQYSDIDYQGRHYGWGPSPPDQFVLNRVHEEITHQANQPFFFSTITQNSHYPWNDVPRLAADWRALDEGEAVVAVKEETKISRLKRKNYLQAIDYQLDFLSDFIIKEGTPNDLFILIGDHQPGWITRRDQGFDTPVHIISKDPQLLAAFAKFGFQPGLAVAEITPTIKHEGFFSLFVRTLLSQYGRGTQQPPPYLPDGLSR